MSFKDIPLDNFQKCQSAKGLTIPNYLQLSLAYRTIKNAVSEELGTEIRRTALQREIRQVDCDKHKEIQSKKEELMTYKKELLGKVEEHLASLEQLNSKQADLAVFKLEVLQKVEKQEIKLHRSLSSNGFDGKVNGIGRELMRKSSASPQTAKSVWPHDDRRTESKALPFTAMPAIQPLLPHWRWLSRPRHTTPKDNAQQ